MFRWLIIAELVYATYQHLRKDLLLVFARLYLILGQLGLFVCPELFGLRMFIVMVFARFLVRVSLDMILFNSSIDCPMYLDDNSLWR